MIGYVEWRRCSIVRSRHPALRKKAKKFYEWLTSSIYYSFAMDYSIIPNISDFVLKNKYGDCGMQSLAFITLCRYAGIPARFQSGRMMHNQNKSGLHDWTEIYIPNYGWIPVDLNMGQSVYQKQYTWLYGYSDDDREFTRDFYFGGLEPCMAFNREHSKPFDPQKSDFRKDNVDNQYGEAEYMDANGKAVEIPYSDVYDYGRFRCEIVEGDWPLR